MASLNETKPLLDVRGLKTIFHTKDGTVSAVNDVSFTLKSGELLGIVGESGSGKSVTMLSLLKLLPMNAARITGGTARFGGRDLLELSRNEMRKVRGGDIGFIFQDPMTSLNPVFSVGFQIMEPLRIHRKLGKRQAKEQAIELINLVGIPSASERMKNYPHQFSGGQRQRIMIAIALACDPKVLIADEATTALDVTVQAQIIELVKELREKIGMAIIWITHDLGIIAGIADKVAVMYGGQIVEYGDVKAIYGEPLHPYTKALLATLPAQVSVKGTGKGKDKSRLHSIEGQAPNLSEFPVRCAFAPRCSKRFEKCDEKNPPLFEMKGGHKAACWLHEREAHKGEGAAI